MTQPSFLHKDTVLLIIILIGFLGSSFLYFLSFPPIIISVFLGTGVSAVVYRYLGGLEDSSFKFGQIKLSGSLAALIACVWFFNIHLIEQTSIGTSFSPHVKTWFAFDSAKGLPIHISFKGSKFIIPKPRKDILNNNPLRLVSYENSFKVASSLDPHFIYGNLPINDFYHFRFFNAIQESISHFFVTDRLPPFSSHINLDPLPFSLSTQSYGADYSRYTLTDTSGKRVYKGSIYRRQGHIISVNSRYYFVGVVEVNHNPQQNESMYAKFAFGEISPFIDPFYSPSASQSF